MTSTAHPASNTRHHVLEPIRPVLIGVSLGHLALAALIVGLASGSATSPSPPNATPSNASIQLHWFRPTDFLSHLPSSSTSDSNLIQEPRPSAPRNASRYITLSRVTTPSTSQLSQSPNPGLSSVSSIIAPDVATINELDRIDEALYEAFMQVWSPPDLDRLAPSKRTTRLDISLTQDLALVQADLVSPSGSTDLDLSVLLAAEKVAERLRSRLATSDSSKIPRSLPSSFQNSRYVCRIQFQIE